MAIKLFGAGNLSVAIESFVLLPTEIQRFLLSVERNQIDVHYSTGFKSTHDAQSGQRQQKEIKILSCWNKRSMVYQQQPQALSQFGAPTPSTNRQGRRNRT